MTSELAIFTQLDAIERADLAPSTRIKYRKAIMGFLDTGGQLADTQALTAYAATLSSSGRSFLKAAVALLTGAIADELKASATPENLATVQAGLLRLEAITNSVKVHAAPGTKAHTWLTRGQVKQLMATCDNTQEGRRDWIAMGVLVGAGLRRDEACKLTFDAIKAQGGRTVLEVHGKGDKYRVIPISAALARRLAAWQAEVGPGQIMRSLGRKQEIGTSLSEVALFQITRKHGSQIGKALAPHDLRRTYAQLGYEAGIPITQISKLLGHSSIATTQKYLNLDIDLETTISDFIPLGE